MWPRSRTLFLLALGIVSAGPARADEAVQGKTAALVNGEAITVDEVDAVIRRRPTGLIPLTPSQQRELRLDVLGGLIDDLLLRQFLRQNAPPVEPGELDKQMAALEASLKAQEKTFADFCRETGQTPDEVRAGMLTVLQLGGYSRANTSEEQLRKYYQANKDYFDRVTVRASHVVLRVPRDAPAAERDPARRKLEELRAEIAAGKTDFAEAAKKYSQCPSAPQGGDIGFFTRKWMVDEAFAAAAFGLKVGELSGVVETDFGLHLIKVTERTPGTPSTFEASVEDVRDCYTEELRQQLLQRLRKSAKVTVTLP